ncbi:6-pyruvoyl trahydropterin synthase family protein [Pseudomaricurvus alkylphenolicus]|uniref:6-pyruvoyl trahydropterin synthase family protein n=1 Tax=Pseudomaricurvus alkylphenolicus TaxID=1306991 RepID=UPI0030B8C636
MEVQNSNNTDRQRLTTIDISKEYLHFSAAHFTVFSATERERLHGHNFFVSASATARVGDDGMCFDYSLLKKKLAVLCQDLDEYMLLARDCPYHSIEDTGSCYEVHFNGEVIPFPKADTLLLPVTNITIEELSHYLLQQLQSDPLFGDNPMITELVMRVSSGPGQWGSSHWVRS